MSDETKIIERINFLEQSAIDLFNHSKYDHDYHKWTLFSIQDELMSQLGQLHKIQGFRPAKREDFTSGQKLYYHRYHDSWCKGGVDWINKSLEDINVIEYLNNWKYPTYITPTYSPKLSEILANI